ncbi:hypothetical protein FA95DRAFT_1566612 [Auriscalpium vulgare]|uniref:Uncharacterized protein n=1 Tax=Auriscalpium vulgare TaxID=40419 RepID=A0ACB8R7M0_9AGAM|nr:hypothetical protein FA95DRAFT_1566612 [Auriscalpium vulgare]
MPSISAPTDAAKKKKKLRPTQTKTPRNLYAIDYKNEHPNATVDEFDIAYAALSDNKRQYYNLKSLEEKNKAKKTAKSA